LLKDELADIKNEFTGARELQELKQVEEKIIHRLGRLVGKDSGMKKKVSVLKKALNELELS